MEVTILRKKITNLFKLSGINLLGDDCNYLAEKLAQVVDSEQDGWLNKIIDTIQSKRLDRGQINRTVLESAISELHRVGLDDREPVFSVLNVFKIPRFSYNVHTKMFKRDERARKIMSDVSMKATHLRQRYLMLLQKTQRHKLFAPQIIENGVSEESRAKKFKLLFVENLLSSSYVADVVILGYLTQMNDGKYYLADLTGNVQLDLQNARFHSGFFCKGSFVLAEGNYKDKLLHVSGLGFPPAELAKDSNNFIGQHNTWGGDSDLLLKNSKRLAEHEYFNSEATIVFVSDVRLDAPDVKQKLRKLFLGFDDFPPVAIVLMGPFSSTSSDLYDLRNLLRDLGELANSCNHLKADTDLILVPANDDPAAPAILPRPPLPKALAIDLVKLWPRTILATNPCRLQYCTQQITVCRLDLMVNFCRNTLHYRCSTCTLCCSICQSHKSSTICCTFCTQTCICRPNCSCCTSSSISTLFNSPCTISSAIRCSIPS